MAHQTVLVVDDDDTVRLSFRDYLREHGHKVFVASDGVGAIQHLIDEEITYVVTDYRMALFGGDYWVRFLKRFCGEIPVQIISGFLPADMDLPFPILTKPFSYDELERQISGGDRDNRVTGRDNLKAFIAMVHGTVQGVGFRYYARSAAHRCGVGGYVQNQPDGSVKVVCEGPTAAVDAMAAWLQKGPPSARVTLVELHSCPPTGSYPTFTVEF